ncbi:hypothetical protein Pmani_017144, partial [Petrolisthes manimaculis]
MKWSVVEKVWERDGLDDEVKVEGGGRSKERRKKQRKEEEVEGGERSRGRRKKQRKEEEAEGGGRSRGRRKISKCPPVYGRVNKE